MDSFRCRLCGDALDGGGLSLGPMPLCNRFTSSRQAAERHDLRVLQCPRCHLIQLGNAASVETVRPRLPWIRYREPEAHLDAIAKLLLAEHCPRATMAFGVGPFDQPLLGRLTGRGLRASALDMRPPRSDADEGFPYLETWQQGLNADHLADVADAQGTADIVCCRYLLEHCHDPLGALHSLRHLLSRDGMLIVEVPDSSKFLAACDYAFIWEEHISYFVEDTFRRLAARAGYEVAELRRVPGELEDALIAVLRPAQAASHIDAIPSSCLRFAAYVAGIEPTRKFVQSWVAKAAGASGDGLALFGIGHQAVMFANALGLADRVAAAVDDDPDKNGYFPPGFRVPVIPSQVLLDDTAIKACLFAVAPGIEHKVRERLAPLAARGVEFRSIFAAAPGSLLSGSPSWH